LYFLAWIRQVKSDDELSSKANVRWRQLLRPDVFASRQYVVLCVNNTLLCFGLSVVYVHLYVFAVGSQPDVQGPGKVPEEAGMMDEGRGYTDPTSAALLLSAIGAANLVGRFIFGLMSSARPVSPVDDLLLIPAPKALSTLSQKSETVAGKCDCRRKRRDNGEIRRLSHFSATVWTGFN